MEARKCHTIGVCLYAHTLQCTVSDISKALIGARTVGEGASEEADPTVRTDISLLYFYFSKNQLFSYPK